MSTHRTPSIGTFSTRGTVWPLALAACLLAIVEARGDDPGPVVATISSAGGPRTGRILGTADSGLRFEPSDGGPAIDLDGLDKITFEPTPGDPSGSPPAFQVELAPRGRISGQLGQVREETIQLQEGPGGAPLSIVRGGVRAVIQRPGEVQAIADGFEAEQLDMTRWSSVGSPSLADDPVKQGRQSLWLPPGGSALTCQLSDAVESGRFEVAYYDDARRARNHSRFVDLAFRGAGGVRSIQVLLGWENSTLGVQTRGSGPTMAVQPLVRKPGWHRLTVRFGPDRTDVAVDGIELAHGDAVGGPLVEVRLASDASSGNPDEDLDAYFDDLRLVRFAEPAGSVEVEPVQDDVRLISGDQLFGTVSESDSERITLVLDGKSVMLPWSEVAGVYLRRRLVPSETLEGLWVRVRWRPDGVDDDRDLDHVEGVLAAIDDNLATVNVPYVGTIHLPSHRLVGLSVLGKARRTVLDPSHRHLGNSVVADLDPPQPEGTTLALTIPIESVPTGPTTLALDVIQVIGVEGDVNYSRQVRQGELLTRVSLNGQNLGDLNHLVTRRNDEPLRIRLPIPEGILREGDNVLQFDQTGTKGDPDKVDNIGLLGLGLEIAQVAPPRPGP